MSSAQNIKQNTQAKWILKKLQEKSDRKLIKNYSKSNVGSKRLGDINWYVFGLSNKTLKQNLDDIINVFAASKTKRRKFY